MPGPPSQLPADFFDKPGVQSAPDTLPADFFETKPAEKPKTSKSKGLLAGVGSATLGLVESGKGAVKELAKEGENIADVATLGLKPYLEKKIAPLGKARAEREELTRATNPLEAAGGQAVQAAEMFTPIPGVSAIKAGAGAGRLARVAATAGREALDIGLKTAVQTGSAKQTAEAAAFGGAAGGAVERLIGKAAGEEYGPVSSWLRKHARAQYAKVIHPLGRKAKEAAEEIGLGDVGKTGDLVEQGITAWTKEGLAGKIDQQVQQVGQQIGEEYKQLDATSKMKLQPLYDSFESFLNKKVYNDPANPSAGFVYGGKALHDEGLKVLAEAQQGLQRMLPGAAGPARIEALPSEIWKYRQTIDKFVYDTMGGFGKVNPNQAATQLASGLGDSLRAVMNSEHPSIAALNDRYHMWSTAAKLIKRNITNEVGQKGFAKMIGAGGLGLATGTEERERGHGWIESIAKGAAAAALGAAFTSTAWRTVSAVTKDKIAQLISRGEGQAAADLAARATGLATR